MRERGTSTDWAILQVDVKNAFNSLARSAVLKAVSERAPELSSWAAYSYAQHSLLFMEGEPLRSQCGVQQGDPLGPLFFSMGCDAVVEALPPSLHLNLW